MSLNKVVQLRKGTTALTVFKAEEDGTILLSLDKDFVSRRIKGPLFSEAEIKGVVELIHEYIGWESKVVHGNQSELKLATSEIAQAIKAAATKTAPEGHAQKDGTKSDVRITVIPWLPKYRYLHTCNQCGCHVQSSLRLGGTELRLCSGCRKVHSVYVLGEREW